jgi:hypothetical protein
MTAEQDSAILILIWQNGFAEQDKQWSVSHPNGAICQPNVSRWTSKTIGFLVSSR